MSIWGAGIGAILGSRAGILGSLAGAVLGNWLEGKLRKSFLESNGAAREETSNELAVLTGLSAMLAKIAKADGRVSENEVRYCESVFDRIGLSGEKREYCIRVFRRAKNDAHTIEAYAQSFAQATPDVTVRTIVYDILWDLACADGGVTIDERELLHRVVSALGLDPQIYVWQCNRRGVRDAETEGAYPSNPYTVLGVKKSASDDEVRSAYRERAKKLHPDILRAQGLSEELVEKANSEMARLNAAWNEIRKARGI